MEALAGSGVPDARSLVVAGGDDELAVGAEGAVQDAAPVSVEDVEALAGSGVPDARRLVVAGGGDEAAAGAEDCGCDGSLVVTQDVADVRFGQARAEHILCLLGRSGLEGLHGQTQALLWIVLHLRVRRGGQLPRAR